MSDTTCTVDACERPIKNKTLGYCDPHYKRFWRYGDVQAEKPVPPKRAPLQPIEDFPDGTRRCQGCSLRLPLDSFHRDPSSPLGRKSKCGPCRIIVETRRYHDNAEDVKVRVTNYRKANAELVRSRDALRYERDKEKRLVLAIANTHVRRARILNQGFERGVTVPALRKRDGDQCHYCSVVMVFGHSLKGHRRDTMATLEHVTPISRGGTHTFDNCVLACWRCNISKGACDPESWKATRLTGTRTTPRKSS